MRNLVNFSPGVAGGCFTKANLVNHNPAHNDGGGGHAGHGLGHDPGHMTAGG